MDKTQVSLWEPHDFNFEAEVKKDNLFKVDFHATVKVALFTPDRFLSQVSGC